MNGLYVAASGASSLLSGVDTAANNLANVSTPGFRRVLDVVESLTGDGSPYEYASATASPTLDMSQGPLQQTGNPLDIAISGPAFLVVQTPDGPAYTRDGELQVTPDGQLQAAGLPLSADGGGTITLPPGKLSIATDGTVSVNGAAQGKLALADPTGVQLAPIGNSLYRPVGQDSLPPATSGSQIHQGFIEGTVSSEIADLVSLVDLMRGYEASMKAVSSIDQNQNQAIQTFTLQA